MLKFDGSFGENELTMLRCVCERFISNTKAFNEIVLFFEIASTWHNVFNYSYRPNSKANISELDIPSEFKEKAILLRNGEFIFLEDSKNEKFDFLLKMTSRSYILINNTELTVNQMRVKYKLNTEGQNFKEQLNILIRDFYIVVGKYLQQFD